MKTVDDYMKLPYRMELLPDIDEGGFAVRFPELPGCLSTGDTIEEACANGQDARRAWIEAALEEGYRIPEPFAPDDFSGQFKLRLPKSLHRDLVLHAREEGISMNQYCVYLLSKRDAERVAATAR